MNTLRAVVASLLLMGSAAPALAQVDRVSAQILDAERLTDSGAKAGSVPHSQKTLEMADAISEPELFVAALVMSANPEVWLKILKQAGKPGTLRNLAGRADPGMLVDWFYASVDPRFQRAILSRTLDVKKQQRWMDSMNDPRFFMPAIAAANRSMVTHWVKVAADGRRVESSGGEHGIADGAWLRLRPAGSAATDSTAFAGPVQRY